ncbi:MAG TPA: 7-cyano-7-deazaguanine synthase [Candidatus Nitrosopolaris sp.]|nr:7-cyano-7-deazaguanine synthase [Candidatus Nitrosopolaris sp.]
MKGSKALVMLSGGLDSATCLYWAKEKYSDVSAITFNCYDRLQKEKESAAQLAKRASISNFLEIDIPFIKEYSDLQIGRSQKSDSRWPSYVPARNLIFYSIAAHYAEFLNIKWIVGGHNSHDGSFFKDATNNYLEKINSLFKHGCLLSNDDPCVIVTPLLKMNKKRIINLAIHLKVPLEVTWSCHTKARRHCGECYSCKKRLDAFRSLGMKDPVFRHSKILP